MKIALIADNLTVDSLSLEPGIKIKQITPMNYKFILALWRPDLLLVESAWEGKGKSWKKKIASYGDKVKRNRSLEKAVNYAKKKNIGAIFWNKEDGVHYERFIESAKLFEHILTVDENCVERYKKDVVGVKSVGVMMFAIQEKIHNLVGVDFDNKRKAVSFLGSLILTEHPERLKWQNIMFKAVLQSGLKLDFYNRHKKKGEKKNLVSKMFPGVIEKEGVSHKDTAEIYKKYLVSLNVNTIENSKTMFSRRLIEIIACGGLAITNKTLATEDLFGDYCIQIENEEECVYAFEKIMSNGLTDGQIEQIKKGAEFIAKNHSWKNRIEQISKVMEGWKNV